MKKIIAAFMLAILTLSLMTGCAKLEDKVLGTWVVTEDKTIEIDNRTIDVRKGETLLTIWEDGTCNLNLRQVGNNEYSTSEWSIVNGDELKIHYEAPLCFVGTFCYPVQIDGDKMTWGNVELEKEN